MTMQEFLTRVFTTAAKLYTTENVLPHSYEVSNPMALPSYRHGTRKAATPVGIARSPSSRHFSRWRRIRGRSYRLPGVQTTKSGSH
jgi:hypothetical protein